MARLPSQTWYLMLASDVRPTSGKSAEPRATGKNRSATHKLPAVPSRRAAFSSRACHLRTSHVRTKFAGGYFERPDLHILASRLQFLAC
jgi:hypothetical protein